MILTVNLAIFKLSKWKPILTNECTILDFKMFQEDIYQAKNAYNGKTFLLLSPRLDILLPIISGYQLLL